MKGNVLFCLFGLSHYILHVSHIGVQIEGQGILLQVLLLLIFSLVSNDKYVAM